MQVLDQRMAETALLLCHNLHNRYNLLEQLYQSDWHGYITPAFTGCRGEYPKGPHNPSPLGVHGMDRLRIAMEPLPPRGACNREDTNWRYPPPPQISGYPQQGGIQWAT